MTFDVHTTKVITKEEKNLVLDHIKLCFRELKKKKHEISIKGPISKMYSWPEIIIKCAGVRSRAGANKIIIDIASWRNGSTFMLEYAAYAESNLIGSQRFSHRDDALLCKVAHEVSHHVQYRYGPYTRWLKNTYRKPHGTGFQNIYGILRREIVNPRIETEVAA